VPQGRGMNPDGRGGGRLRATRTGQSFPGNCQEVLCELGRRETSPLRWSIRRCNSTGRSLTLSLEIIRRGRALGAQWIVPASSPSSRGLCRTPSPPGGHQPPGPSLGWGMLTPQECSPWICGIPASK